MPREKRSTDPDHPYLSLGTSVKVGPIAAGLSGSVVGAVMFVRVLVELSSDYSFSALFEGWQVVAVEAALPALLLALAVVSGRALLRRRRTLRGRVVGRAPRPRVVVAAALLPGLFFGVLAGAPMRASVSWASEHTAAATAFHAKIRQSLREYRLHPPVMRALGPAAPPAVSARMLHASDLGAGWYDGFRPNPHLSDRKAAGVRRTAMAFLTKQRWSGQAWSLDRSVMERRQAFRTPTDAQLSVRTVWARPGSTCHCTFTPLPIRRVDGVTIWQHLSKSSMGTTGGAAFVVGPELYSLVVYPDNSSTGAADLTKAIAAAVRRAAAQQSAR